MRPEIRHAALQSLQRRRLASSQPSCAKRLWQPTNFGRATWSRWPATTRCRLASLRHGRGVAAALQGEGVVDESPEVAAVECASTAEAEIVSDKHGRKGGGGALGSGNGCA